MDGRTSPETHSHLNQKKFWSYIKALRKENTNVPVLKKNDINNYYETSLDKAEILNDQFQSVFTIETDSPLPDKGPSLHPTIPDITIHKACGPDQIRGRILKEMADIISPFLRTLF